MNAALRTLAPNFSACDAPPDLGLPYLWKPAAGSRSSARRPRHATKATNSLAAPGSLQLLPRPTRRQTGKPPDDTRTLFRQGGSP